MRALNLAANLGVCELIVSFDEAPVCSGRRRDGADCRVGTTLTLLHRHGGLGGQAFELPEGDIY